jgi:hypothetical protein
MPESSLHQALKDRYTRTPEDRQEVSVDGYQIDVVCGGLLVEVQTGSFTHLKAKLADLLPKHPLLLVHPIPVDKWIVRLNGRGDQAISRRKSPRHGQVEAVFRELVRIAPYLKHPNLYLEVILTREEEILQNDGRGSWRRKGWSIADRRLLEVVQVVSFYEAEDYCRFIPAEMPAPFTSRELARVLRVPAYLGYKIVYCLRAMGLLEPAGQRGRARLFQPAKRCDTLGNVRKGGVYQEGANE